MASPTLAMQRAWAILPKITGWASVLCSGLLVWTVMRDQRRRSLTYHRLLCGISLCDMSASFWLGMSTWPINAQQYPDTLWAVGNFTTCRVQGFFTQFGVASSFYNASLSVYYYLVIVQGWKESQLQRIEWLLHCIPLLWSLVSAIVGLTVRSDIYDNATLWCWVSADEQVFRWAAFYGPLWCNIGIVTGMSLAVYIHVRRIEAASAKYNHLWLKHLQQKEGCPSHQPQLSSDFEDGNGKDTEEDKEEESTTQQQQQSTSKETSQPSPRNMRRFGSSGRINNSARLSGRLNALLLRQQHQQVQQANLYQQSRRVKEVAQQCFLYAAAFYINWLALTATRLIQLINGKIYYPLILIAAVTVPMQGLPNFLVYLRPKLTRARRKDPTAGWWQWVRKSLARHSAAIIEQPGDDGHDHAEHNSDDDEDFDNVASNNPSSINEDGRRMQSGVSLLEELQREDTNDMGKNADMMTARQSSIVAGDDMEAVKDYQDEV